MHISFEEGVLEDPWVEPPKDMFVLTQPQDQTPNEPVGVEVEFENGIAVAWNGRRMACEMLIQAVLATQDSLVKLRQ